MAARGRALSKCASRFDVRISDPQGDILDVVI
jgi:hypothetical protein